MLELLLLQPLPGAALPPQPHAPVCTSSTARHALTASGHLIGHAITRPGMPESSPFDTTSTPTAARNAQAAVSGFQLRSL